MLSRIQDPNNKKYNLYVRSHVEDFLHLDYYCVSNEQRLKESLLNNGILEENIASRSKIFTQVVTVQDCGKIQECLAPSLRARVAEALKNNDKQI